MGVLQTTQIGSTPRANCSSVVSLAHDSQSAWPHDGATGDTRGERAQTGHAEVAVRGATVGEDEVGWEEVEEEEEKEEATPRRARRSSHSRAIASAER